MDTKIRDVWFSVTPEKIADWRRKRGRSAEELPFLEHLDQVDSRAQTFPLQQRLQVRRATLVHHGSGAGDECEGGRDVRAGVVDPNWMQVGSDGRSITRSLAGSSGGSRFRR